MTSLRIVLVMIEPPLPFGNPAARWYYVLLKGLTERGHRVAAFATCSKPHDVATATELFPAPRYRFRCYPHPKRDGVRAKWETFWRPYSYMFSPELRRDLAGELAQGFDLLHLEPLWAGWLGLDHPGKAVVNVLNLFEIDLMSLPPNSAVDRVRRWRVYRAERYLLRQYPTIMTLSHRMEARIREVANRAEIHVLPLALDLSHYPKDVGAVSSGPPVVGLIGSFTWQPTYSAGKRLLNRLWPEIKRQVPEARLQIVGREARSALGDHGDLADVTIHENVPDIVPYFAATDVLVYAPAPSTGMKVKVLESFALGVPVVTTPDGVEGIPAADGVHAGIAETDQQLVSRVVELLRQPQLRQRRREAARELLTERCAPDVVLDRLEEVYEAVRRKHATKQP